uniref:Anti-sigma factor antagonist n=1 Tax=Fervidobacterium thailandense TaxID=1008305 RepID=A0A7C5VPR4_9BACT
MYRYTEQLGVAIVALEGDVSMQNAMSLRNWVVDNLIKAGKVKIVFDFSKVGSVDSFGLGTFVSIHKTAVSNGGSIAFASVNENVKKLLSLTALDKVIRTFDSVSDAVNAIR